MSPFFLWTKDGKVENRLPMLFMVTPRWFKERYPEMAQNLLTNQNRLVNAFDMYPSSSALLNEAFTRADTIRLCNLECFPNLRKM